MSNDTTQWMPVELTGKTAVVCGASQGIGLATAQHLAGLGARVILMARNKDKLEIALATLSEPSRHGYSVADFSDSSLVKTAIQTIVEREPVHILVNNTGGPAGGAHYGSQA